MTDNLGAPEKHKNVYLIIHLILLGNFYSQKPLSSSRSLLKYLLSTIDDSRPGARRGRILQNLVVTENKEVL